MCCLLVGWGFFSVFLFGLGFSPEATGSRSVKLLVRECGGFSEVWLKRQPE